MRSSRVRGPNVKMPMVDCKYNDTQASWIGGTYLLLEGDHTDVSMEEGGTVVTRSLNTRVEVYLTEFC